MPELISLFDAAGAGEVVLYPLWPRPSTPAGRGSCRCAAMLTAPGVLPGLILHRDDGGFTEAAQDVMNGAAACCIRRARNRATGGVGMTDEPGQSPASSCLFLEETARSVVPVVRLSGVIASSSQMRRGCH